MKKPKKLYYFGLYNHGAEHHTIGLSCNPWHVGDGYYTCRHSFNVKRGYLTLKQAKKEHEKAIKEQIQELKRYLEVLEK